MTKFTTHIPEKESCFVQGSSSEALSSNLRYYLAVELAIGGKLIARLQYYGNETIIDEAKSELEANKLYSALVHSAFGRMIHGHVLTSIKQCYSQVDVTYIKGAC